MAPYLTAENIKNRVPSLENVDDDHLAELVAEFEATAERYRGRAFTPREVTETIDVRRDACEVVLAHRPVTAVSAIAVAGTPWSAEDRNAYVAACLDSGSGILRRWPRPGARAVVTYTHGMAAPPPAILRACREFVRAEATLEGTDIPRDAASYTDESGMTWRYETASWDDGRPTGIGIVDRLLNTVQDHRLPGFA